MTLKALQTAENGLHALYKNKIYKRVLDSLAALQRAHKQSDAYSLESTCSRFLKGENAIKKRELPTAEDIKLLFDEFEKLNLGKRIDSRKFKWGNVDPRSVGLVASGTMNGKSLLEITSQPIFFELSNVPTDALIAELKKRVNK